MRRYFSIAGVLAALALLAVGCDSNDESGPTDAERFVGSWTAIAISDSNGDQSAEFAAIVSSLIVVMQEGDDPAFSLTVDYTEDSGRDDLVLAGTYAVDDGPRNLTLTIASGASLPFTYSFEDDSRAILTTSAALVNPIFNPTTPYEGTVRVTIQKQ